MHVIVQHSRIRKELQERDSWQAGISRMTKQCMKFIHAREPEDIERLLCVYDIGDTFCLGAGKEHESALSGKENHRVELKRRGFGQNDIARDRLASGVSAFVGDGERPDAVVGKSVKRELAELTLRESLCSRGDSEDFITRNGNCKSRSKNKRIIDIRKIYQTGCRDKRIWIVRACLQRI